MPGNAVEYSYNFIGQFVTILSVNKTRIKNGRICVHFFFGWAHFASILFFAWVELSTHFLLPKEKLPMNKTRYLTQAAIIAALYAVLTHMQNLLLPGTTTWAIQMRISEAMNVLAFFTPAAIPGLSLGCLVFNLTYAGTLPLDFLVGTLATFLAALAMWKTRNVKIGKLPLLGLVMPAVTNAFLVGWELTVYIGGGFGINALYVALGELAVVLVLGTALYFAITARSLDKSVLALD